MTIDNGTTVKTLKFYYDAAGIPMCLDYNGTIYFYITNLQGDVMAPADQYGEVIRYEYDAWGKPIISEYYFSTHGEVMQYNPLRYRGYIYDAETGFYYLQSRYYDPTIGRFINSDGQLNGGFLGNNMFAYCGNNPVNRVDYTGEAWKYILLMLTPIPGPWVLGLIAEIKVASDMKNKEKYASEDEAALAWKNKYQSQSETQEYGAIIYEITNSEGEVSYILGKTYPGNSKNVIAGFLAGYTSGGIISIFSPRQRMVGFVHSHPAPDPKGHNDYPSETDEWLLNLPGIDEVYVIPWRPCRGRTDFIKTTEESNWKH